MVLAGAGAAVAIGGAAGVITAPKYLYEQPKTGYYSISPSELKVLTGVFPNTLVRDKLTHIDVSSTSPRTCFSTGLHLPNEAKLQKLSAVFRAFTEADLGPELAIMQINYSTTSGLTTLYHAIYEDGCGPDPVEREGERLTAKAPKISNGDYSYAAHLCLPAGGAFYGAKLEYTYTSAGD